MKRKDIPDYMDPSDFEMLAENAKYPCSTERMTYDPLLHKYFITQDALLDFGVDVGDDYDSDNTNKVRQFIEEVTEDVYGVMMRLAPFNYEYNCYLVAQSLSRQYPSRYAARKQFEKALLYQAQYKVRNIDVRDFSGVDIENGKNLSRQTLQRELRHISPKTLDILRGLGLLFNGNIPGKHLIDYNRGM